jgi:hypothetical protein
LIEWGDDMNKPLTMAQARRAGVLAAHSVEEFVISVPDLDVAAEFYTLFGLRVEREGNSLGIYTYDTTHRYGRVILGSQKRLQWITMGIYAEDSRAF